MGRDYCSPPTTFVMILTRSGRTVDVSFHERGISAMPGTAPFYSFVVRFCSGAARRPWPLMCQLSIAAIVVAILIANHSPLGTQDSRMFHTGAVLLGPDLYSPERQAEIQQPFTSPYFRAPFYAAFLRILTSFGHFPRTWFALNLLATALLTLILPAALGVPWHLSALVPVFLPLIASSRIEQDSAITLLMIGFSLCFAQRHHDLAAGVFLALTLHKPTLLLLVPVAILVHRRHRILAGYTVTAFVLGTFSFLLVGPPAVADYVRLVRGFQLVFPKMPTARAVAVGLDAEWLWPLFIAATTVTLIYVARRTDFCSAFCLSIVGSLFVSPQSYQHDFALLLLPVLLAVAQGSTLGLCASAILLYPPTYFLLTTEGTGYPQVIRGTLTGLYFAVLALSLTASNNTPPFVHRTAAATAGPRPLDLGSPETPLEPPTPDPYANDVR